MVRTISQVLATPNSCTFPHQVYVDIAFIFDCVSLYHQLSVHYLCLPAMHLPSSFMCIDNSLGIKVEQGTLSIRIRNA